jgi:hypothetical protein
MTMRVVLGLGLLAVAFAMPVCAADTGINLAPPTPEEATATGGAAAIVPSPGTPPASVEPAKEAAPVDLGKAVAAQELGTVDPDAMGLLSPSVGGLGSAMWENTSRGLVERVMQDMTLPASSPAINSLASRLLLTTAAVPSGDTILKRSLVSLRLEKLLELGDVTGAWQLAMMAKPGSLDDTTMRTLTEAALMGPDSKDLCARMPEFMAGHKDAEWQKALILCQLRAGDTKAVQLGLDVMREQQVKDDVFITMMNRAMLGGGRKLPRHITPLKPLVLGILRQLDLPLPPDMYARPEAVLVPEMLRAKAEDDVIRLVLAEKSAAKGIISGSQLAAVYRDIPFKPEALPAVLNGGETGPRFHALLFQAAAAELTPGKRAELIVRFMQGADPMLLCGAGGQALAELAASVPVSADIGTASAEMARLMTLAGKPERALEWLNLARSVAVKIPAVADQVKAGWPLFVLSGIVTDVEYGTELASWLNSVLGKATDETGQERDQRRKAAAVLVMFSASGYAVPEPSWLRVVNAIPESKRMMVPSAILLDRLRSAGVNNRRGEVALLSILLVGNGSGEVPLFVTADAVRALRLVGLKADAFALAREVVVGY